MSYDLFVASLGDPPPASGEKFLSLVRGTALACVPQRDDRWYVGDTEGGKFEIEMPHGDAVVHEDHVAFQLRGMDLETARLIFTIAKEAGLDIINEGGHPHFIVTDATRVDSLSDTFRSENPAVCRSSEELAAVLLPNFQVRSDEKKELIRQRDLLYSRWTRNHEIRSIGHGDPEPNVPGRLPQRDLLPIYLEAKEAEGWLLMFRRFDRYFKNRNKAGEPKPDRGGLRGSSWEIRLPSGAIFHCLLISGHRYSAAMDSASRNRGIVSWKQVLEEFAKETGRRTAEIEERRVFVSDGSSYPIEECESRRARDED